MLQIKNLMSEEIYDLFQQKLVNRHLESEKNFQYCPYVRTALKKKSVYCPYVCPPSPSRPLQSLPLCGPVMLPVCCAYPLPLSGDPLYGPEPLSACVDGHTRLPVCLYTSACLSSGELQCRLHVCRHWGRHRVSSLSTLYLSALQGAGEPPLHTSLAIIDSHLSCDLLHAKIMFICVHGDRSLV